MSEVEDQLDRSELLGFIRFNEKNGSVELVNFQAELKRSYMTLGGSTKKGHEEFAGHHGEGLKLAAMVLRREGHSVRLGACAYYWNFRFRGHGRSILCCRLSRANAEVIEKKKREHAFRSAKPKFKRGLTINIWEDVFVRIGKAKKDPESKISKDQFRTWLTVAIELNPPLPEEIIRTPAGDLILNQRFAGHVYVKGLLVMGTKATYIYGYNFSHGMLNRDRDRFVNSSEEGKLLTAVWEQAILFHGPRLAAAYLKLFEDDEATTEASLTGKNLSKSAVESIWDELKRSQPGAFFYVENEVSESVGANQVNALQSPLSNI